MFLAGIGAFWRYQQKTEEKTPKDVFHRAAMNIHTRWSKGDDEGQWQAGKLTCEGLLGMPGKTESHYLRCNPNFLSCWYRYRNEVVRQGGRKYSFKVRFPSSGRLPFTRREGALLVEIEGHGETFKISLFDTCSEVLLPQGFYGHGQYSSPEEDWRWDNMGRHIFVDKFLVSNRDVWEWGGAGEKGDFNHFPAPAVGLDLRQMEDYCVWRGKRLMEAHIFDAASFHPGDVNNLTPPVSIRGHYPWSSERMVLEEAENFSPGLCLRMLDQKCFEREGFWNFSTRSMSWTGMSQVLGGVMEAQRNPLHPHQNLMLSSFYYPYHSSANQLAWRGYWNEKGTSHSDFDFREYLPEKQDSYKVGFRCMREVGPFSPVVVDNSSRDFAYATGVEYDKKIEGKILAEPKGIWHQILKARERCLFYKTPFREEGEIRSGNDCSNAYSNRLLFSGVKNFQVEYKRFKTVLEFETDKEHRMELIHFNKQEETLWERYDPPVNKSYRTGLLIGGWPLEEEQKGNFRDNYKDGSSPLCHRVDRDCQNVLEYSCDQCRFGFFEVADFKCPQGGSKYCGRSRCGEPGMPACLRGYRANHVEVSRCVDGWEAGFCQEGLQRICDENGVLVCSH